MDRVQQFFEKRFAGKTLCILGFGREGKSSYRTLRSLLPQVHLIIADQNPACREEFELAFGKDTLTEISCGENYQSPLATSDVILKSPGISLKTLKADALSHKLTSQTELFLELFKEQVIGVTGTKGKSTTVSLLKHIFHTAGRKVLLGGNIGIAPFELMEELSPQAVVVFEMSSHQLENLKISPAISILLNIYQEHLDHYHSFRDYQLAKFNIARWQQPGDAFIYSADSPLLESLIAEFPPPGNSFAIHGDLKVQDGACCQGQDLHIRHHDTTAIIKGLCARTPLPGKHNLTNVIAAAMAAFLKNVPREEILQAITEFKGLPHRLEYVGQRDGASYFNDSISTIPESTMEALKTFPQTHSLLLGGYDRGVAYDALLDYLAHHPVPCILFIGKAGIRMHDAWQRLRPAGGSEVFLFSDFEKAVTKAFDVTPAGKTCLLSPAAASYDMFKNFEERGEKFRQMVLGKHDASA